MDTEEASFLAAQELMTAHVVSMTLKAAMELGLIDVLNAAPEGTSLTARDLVAQAVLPRPAASEADAADAVDRMLQFLAAHGVVMCCSTEEASGGGDCTALRRRYAKTPVCRWFSTNNNGEGSLAPLAMFMFQPPLLNPWQQLSEAVLSGGCALQMANGMPLFEYMVKNPQLSVLYHQAMSQLSLIASRKLIERFAGGFLDDVHVLVDVGGGDGTTLGMITSSFKHIKGINFDLPFVISQAKPIPGIEHVGGNMLDSVPNGDAMFTKMVLHLLNDADCVKLLSNCCRSLPEKGKVMAMEVVLPAAPEPTPAGRFPFQLDVVCLINGFKGCRERTEQEYARLAMDAGFRGPIRSTPIFGGYRLLEFTK